MYQVCGIPLAYSSNTAAAATRQQQQQQQQQQRMQEISACYLIPKK